MSNLLFDRFRKIKIIGQGGMGTVYLVEDVTNEALFAIKEIPIKKRDRKLLLREPLLLKKLDHDSIVKVEDIYETNTAIYIIMEYVHGPSLKELLMQERRFSEKAVIEWAIQICDVLEYLHTLEPHPVVYRDIKPGNIIVNRESNKITLIDFGIACEYKRDHIESAQVALTRGYCAPEQYIEKTFDTRSDIYSLGITIYQLLTGIAPTDNYAKPIAKFENNVSKEMEYIITKATRIDPDERYQSVFDLKYDLINIDRLNRDLRRLVVKQIVAYSLFLLIYVIFGFITYLGINGIRNESVEVSRQLVSDGRVYMHQYNYDLALKSFEKAIKLNPNFTDAYIALLDYYYESAKYDEGINYINANMVKEDPESSMSLQHFKGIEELDGSIDFYLSKFLYKKENYPKSFDFAFRAMSANDSNSTDAKFYMALGYINTGDFERAQPFIDELISLQYDVSKINFLYAERAKYEKKYYEALDFYDLAINNSENNLVISDSIIKKAGVYKDNPDVFNGSEDLYILTLEEGDKKMASKATIELVQTKAAAYDEKAKSAENEEAYISDLKLAAENYARLLDMGKNDLDVFIKLGTTYQSIGDYENAEKVMINSTKAYDRFLSYYYLTNIQFEKELTKKDKNERNFSNALKSYEHLQELAVKESMTSRLQELTKTIEGLGIGV